MLIKNNCKHKGLQRCVIDTIGCDNCPINRNHGGKRENAGRKCMPERLKSKKYNYWLYDWQKPLVDDFVRQLKETDKLRKQIFND